MKYFVPSKTFLTGEYSVLLGGAALGLATSPCFEISYFSHSTNEAFHPQSPAGRYLTQRQKKMGVQFYDPYSVQGVQGGFGKSTAEFFAVALSDIIEKKMSLIEIRQQYLDLFKNEKVKPSGADLMMQYLGKVAYVDSQHQQYTSADWRHKDLDFFVVSTGLKIKTHEHLESLDLSRLSELPGYSNQVIDAYLHKTSEDFLSALRRWSEFLNEKKLTHLSAVEIKEQLEKIDGVKLAKPSGALGADVILVFLASQDKQKVLNALRQKKIKVQASREDLTEGLVSYVG